MTTELTTPADTPFATPAGRLGERGTPDVGPYAQPSAPRARPAVDAVLIDAIRATVGPFVPAPWRIGVTEAIAAPVTGELPTAVTSTPTVELPWIDTFLDHSSPVAPSAPPVAASFADAEVEERAVAEAFAAEPSAFEVSAFEGSAVESEPISELLGAEAIDTVASTATEPGAVTDDESTADGAMLEEVPTTAESIAEAFAADESSLRAEPTAPPADVWPLDEAGAAMRALAGEMPNPPQRAITPLYVPPVASTPPLPMWGDDDLMDIMPVRPPAAEAQEEHWAASARREAERAGSPEAAARALEDLARRVRAGELELPGYAPEMGDAAALAAALAALLGVRR
jgi:hypothetical protein